MAVAGIAATGLGLVERPGGMAAGATEFVHEPSGRQAHNSPSVAADPRSPSTLVVANRVDAPALGCAAAVSTNGGAAWDALELSPGLAAENCFWPRVAFLPDSTLLVLYTELGGPLLLPVNVWLQRYEGLRPAGAPLRVAGDLAYWARMATTGNRVWLTWVQAGPASAENQLGLEPGDNPVMVSRSEDFGRTFAAPMPVGEPTRRVIQPSVVVGDAGLVVVGGLDLGDDVANYSAGHDGQTPPDPSLRWRVVTWVSTDDGRTFGPTSVVSADLVVPQLILADLGPTPGFAVEAATGRIYATWDAGRGDGRDVFLASSEDAGRSWTEPVRIGPTARSQLLPAVAVGPRGRVDVVFYDRSRDPQDVLQAVAVATSSDGGRTFRTAPVSDAATDSRVGLGAQQGVPVQGDHLALLSREDDVVAFWADTGRGSPIEPVQDLGVGVLDLDAGGGRRWALVAVGIGLLCSGAALAGVARTSRQLR
ncbi:MAG: sialidase family protein [Acidimicrobiia bacterium]